MGFYSKRGVSAQKEEVHAATQHLDKGLFPKAFCKIFPDILGHDKNWVTVMHADGAGTKSVLAYLYWRETGDISVWKGIAQDAIVMNLDDLLCAGICDNILFSSTIDRNKKLIPGEVLQAIIEGSEMFFDAMKNFGIRIHYMGGETADVGDVVRTILVNGTMTARWPASKLITNERIKPGDVIVGLASYGQAVYEKEYNSGIGSNGLTSARHDVLEKSYAERFPETFEHTLDDPVVYIGHHKLTDKIEITGHQHPATCTIGKLLLSPTRTYAPLMKELLDHQFDAIHGLVHCSGGGHTKCLKFVPDNARIIKDNLFDPPEVFQLIQQSGRAEDKEMYQVFNMGCRLEIYTPAENADAIISTSEKYGIDARITGRVEESVKKELRIKVKQDWLVY